MILAAEKSGAIRPGATIIEATSGNTGISLAMIAAVRGYRCVLVMPEDMSLERRYVLRAYGAEITLTQATEGMAGAVAKAQELTANTPNSFMPRQFANAENPSAHARTTALEILEQTEGKLDAFVAGVGTGGTLTGVGSVLREELGDEVLIVAVEPAASAVLSGQPAGMHGIQGLGAGFVPQILASHRDLQSGHRDRRRRRTHGAQARTRSGPSGRPQLGCQRARRLRSGQEVHRGDGGHHLVRLRRTLFVLTVVPRDGISHCAQWGGRHR